jgi:HAD domain in Swiss Army Knife RNA repair proteins
MNIIFLDIDGVLNCQVFYDKEPKQKSILAHPDNQICRERVGWLNELCSEHSVSVVISSTWRHSGLEYCKGVLERAGATFNIIGITPDLRHEGCVRGNEIKLWIDGNIEKLSGIKPFDYLSYAIIDDDSDMLLWQAPNFFKTDGYSGLTPNICYKIGRMFKGLLCITH